MFSILSYSAVSQCLPSLNNQRNWQMRGGQPFSCKKNLIALLSTQNSTLSLTVHGVQAIKVIYPAWHELPVMRYNCEGSDRPICQQILQYECMCIMGLKCDVQIAD